MLKTLSLLLATYCLLVNVPRAFALEEVVLQLRWLKQFQFAGYYTALDKGFYNEAGFDVTIVEGGVGIDTVGEVVNGHADYGVTNAELLLHYLNKEPVVALAAIFQHSPHVFLARSETGINHPHDFIGKVVKMSRSDRDVELHAMLKNEGVSLDQLKITEKQATPEDYLNPAIDVVAAYITDQTYYLKKANVKYSVISPTQYGVDFYGDLLFTSLNQIRKSPKQVQAFIKASLKGWQYAMAHPEEVVDILINKYGCQKERAHLLNEAQEMRNLILPEMIELGHMNPGRWQHIAEVFAQNGTISDDFSLDGFIFDPQKFNQHVLKVSKGLAISLLGALTLTLFLFFFNKRLRKEITEREHTAQALQESQKKLSQNIKQTEQFSLSAASILSIQDEKHLFNSISQAIVEYSDFKRVLISLFQDEPPYRELIGFAGVSEEIVAKVRNTELSKSWYTGVFEQGIKLGQFSYYIPHTMKHILNQEAVIYGEDEIREGDGAWHPEDNLFVRMNDEKGEFCGVISVDTSKSGLVPTDEVVRPLEIYGCLIAQIIILRRNEQKRSQLEMQLRQSQKMEAIGSLAGGIAHDFNNILSVILGNVDLALHIQPSQAEYTELLVDIKEAGKKARDIVQHLLAFSRKQDRALNAVRIQKSIEDSIKFLRSTLPSTIEINSDIDLEGVFVNADPTQIYQIILNLCTNSAHAMEMGGQITIRAATIHLSSIKSITNKQLAPGEYVKLAVEDNGVGIAPKHLHQIFDPYFTTKDFGKGTGMGLSIVHGIVESHSGVITVESNPGKTIFTVYLPVSGPEQEEIPVLPARRPAPAKGEHIMVVEDNQDLLNIVSRQLTANGYTVSPFFDSQQAYESYASSPEQYDLVITDMTMPRLTGAELAKKILQLRPACPVFLYTGFSEKIDEKLAAEMGIRRYFEKPVDIGKLIHAMREEFDQN